MYKCTHYSGNNYCNLYASTVASAYCGDICKDNESKSEYNKAEDKCEKN